MKSVLVIFGKELPPKNKKWFERFDRVISPEDLEELIDGGSVQQACEFLNKLSRLTLPDGSRLPKLVNYHGYELWWIHYDTIYNQFCLPYTQYARLLSYLKNFETVYLFQPPRPDLFRYYLKAHHCQCHIFHPFRLKNLLPVSLGVFIQVLLSLGFLFWLKITRPALMVRTSDKFNPPNDFDFRLKFIYQELRGRKIPLVEFIRSLEHWPVVLRHAWQRKRPVIYSAAIIDIVHFLTRRFSRLPFSFSEPDPEKHFWLLVATHYLHNFKGTIWSIRLMKFILQWIGVKSAIFMAGGERNLHEILGCKLAGIKAVGILHATTPRYFCVSDFMPEFDGEKSLAFDKYGLWSEWWQNYYLKYSRVYQQEQLYISGPPRPLKKELRPVNYSSPKIKGELIKVLFVSEQLAFPKEVMPYLLALLSKRDFEISLKIRPQIDGFAVWLKKHVPDLLKRVKTLEGDIQQAIAQSDVVVGSHSTAVLEAIAQLKPFIFFQTNKWGDYFDIKSSFSYFFAENPQDLIDKIRKSLEVPKEDLKKIQKQFFGDPNQNGSQWLVEQALALSQNYARD